MSIVMIICAVVTAVAALTSLRYLPDGAPAAAPPRAGTRR